MSCLLYTSFEGVIEYYKATGDEKKRDTAIRFADKLIAVSYTHLDVYKRQFRRIVK